MPHDAERIVDDVLCQMKAVMHHIEREREREIRGCQLVLTLVYRRTDTATIRWSTASQCRSSRIAAVIELPLLHYLAMLDNLFNRAIFKIFKVSEKDVIHDIRNFIGLHHV